ncbi:MAG: hypothetical protein EKK41_07545 [Hyphomicrobiales bacterium]|nr:MAG: hypothetical protein EKK41_07545 [Hyphomicrobiales bacterium]
MVSEVDDVGFVRTLIETLVERGEAEKGRIYLAGISNGGMMTFRLLCEAAPLFAGAATIIANMPAPTGAACKPAKAVPLIMFNGTGDPIVPYAGGRVGFKGMRGAVWGAEETARLFAGRAGCSTFREIQVPRPSSFDLSITRLEWGICAERAGVALFRFEGGGHQVPGGKAFLPVLLGPNTQRVDAAKTIVELFAQLQRGSR